MLRRSSRVEGAKASFENPFCLASKANVPRALRNRLIFEIFFFFEKAKSSPSQKKIGSKKVRVTPPTLNFVLFLMG